MRIPRSKLCVYGINPQYPDQLRWLADAPIRGFKSHWQDMAMWANFGPYTERLGRHHLEEGQQLLDDPERRAEEHFRRLQARSDYPVVGIWMGYNEKAVSDGGSGPSSRTAADTLRRLMQFDRKLAELLHGDGKRYYGGSWSVGQPDVRYEGEPLSWPWTRWDEVAQAFLACDGILGHEYDAPSLFSQPAETFNPWYLHRSDLWMGSFPVQIRDRMAEAGGRYHIGEFGIDLGLIGGGRNGVWGTALSAEQYLAQLIRHAEIYEASPTVGKVFIYCLGDFGGWQGYDIGRAALIARGIAERARQMGFIEVNEGGATVVTVLPGIPVVVDQIPHHATKRYGTRPVEGIEAWVWHHTGAVMGVPALECAVRTADYHIREHNWPAIGYGLVIDLHGNAVQTQYLETWSYHCGDYNPKGFGILLDGDYRNPGSVPTPEQLATCERIIRLKPAWKVLGHYEVSATACPGPWFRPWRDNLGQPPQTDWEAEAKHLREENAGLRAKCSYALNRAREIVEFVD